MTWEQAVLGGLTRGCSKMKPNSNGGVAGLPSRLHFYGFFPTAIAAFIGKTKRRFAICILSFICARCYWATSDPCIVRTESNFYRMSKRCIIRKCCIIGQEKRKEARRERHQMDRIHNRNRWRCRTKSNMKRWWWWGGGNDEGGKDDDD